jgi:ubiquinone/menaquinone biosynthesis C-methylase UbiE
MMKKMRRQSRLSFRFMSMEYRLRDRLRPPVKILGDAGLRPGMAVLDFGCGPGGFSLAAAELVGPAGRVYALDIHPLAIRSVKRAAARRGVQNVTAVDGSADLFAEDTFDAVLLYDVLHDLADSAAVLAEIFRILKPNGFLSVRDHNLNEQVLQEAVTSGGLFKSAGRTRWSYRFALSKGNRVSE